MPYSPTSLVHPLVVYLYLVAVTFVLAMTEALLEVLEEFQNLVLSRGFFMIVWLLFLPRPSPRGNLNDVTSGCLR